MLNKHKIHKSFGDSMRSLIGLKNMLIFSAVFLTIGSASAQQAFAGASCQSINNGNWNEPSNWDFCDGGTPDGTTDAVITVNDIIITGNEAVEGLQIVEGGTLFIDCDASLNLFSQGAMLEETTVTNHGTFTSVQSFFVVGESIFFNSGDFSNVVTEGGSIVEIDSICDRPIGGTVGSMSTTSLLVAGAQANMGLWSLALVGMVAAGAAIIYKTKSKKTEQ